jgi:AcrR family transcriptional regulator
VSVSDGSRSSTGSRTDARRNAERIVQAADEVFAASGVDGSLEEIARRAGVGAATLYRHFASKDDLVHAVIEQAFDDQVEPALQHALDDEVDALAGLVAVLEAALGMASRHRNALAAAKRPGHIPLNLARSFFDRLSILLIRAQAQGLVRQDLQPRDLPRLVGMLITTMWFDETGEGWRRYLALLVDALGLESTTPLPPLPPQDPRNASSSQTGCPSDPEGQAKSQG